MNTDYINTLWGNIFHKMVQSKEETEHDILRKIPIFKELTNKELKIISTILYERQYEAGEYMFETGQPGAAMFIIKSGEIHIQRTTHTDESMLLAKLGEGEFVGELALLDNSPRSASALVQAKTTVLAIFRSDLNQLVDTHPELGASVMRRLAVVIGLRLKATNDLLLKLQDQLHHAEKSGS